MDMSQAGPWIAPWLVVAIVLAVVVLAVLGVLLAPRRRAGPPSTAADAVPEAGPGDDLPGFLEFPPGSAGRPILPPAGWPSLSATATSPPPGPPAAPPRGATHRSALVALGALLLVALVGTVLTLAPRPGGRGPDRADRHPDGATVGLPAVPEAPVPGDPGAGELADATVRPGRDGGAARLAFGGLVLEQRAVGITVTRPVLEVTWDRDEGVAHLRLPTFNCLATTAPDDPVATGCAASVPEYADLPTPELVVSGDDGTLELAGRFPTYVRPNGSPPEWTGRVYEVRLRAAPVDGAQDEGWVPAEGEIRLGSGLAPTLDTADVTVLRRD